MYVAKAGLADFIQPSLGPLQPNLDDYMDTFEPLQGLYLVLVFLLLLKVSLYHRIYDM